MDSAARAAAAAVLAMMSEDDLGRPDVATSFARLPTVLPLRAAGLSGDGDGCSGATASEHAGCAASMELRLEAAPSVGLSERLRAAAQSLQLWRARDRAMLRHVGLLLCLNIGTEPPDRDPLQQPPTWGGTGVLGGRAAATATGLGGGGAHHAGATRARREEAWLDVLAVPSPQLALEEVGRRLARQYERLQPKARVRVAADPKTEDVRKLLVSLRRHAQRAEAGPDRVLLHYNGHGVPRPTANGEIWCFNEGLTAYMPLAATELAAWVGTPVLFVLDCDNAGRLLPFLARRPDGAAAAAVAGAAGGPAGDKRAADGASVRTTTTAATPPVPAPTLAGPGPQAMPGWLGADVLILGASGAEESLPVVPGLPADIFTAGLTTPIKLALQWALHSGRVGATLPRAFRLLVEQLPGRLAEKRSALGELHWLLTTVTDTIAWTLLPRPLFFRLFRQDILCATLFRNFFLADRILRSLGTTPFSFPRLPETHAHPLWAEWDAALQRVLAHLPAAMGFSAGDMERMEALGLAPDVAGATSAQCAAGGLVAAWGTDMPEAAAASAAAAVPASAGPAAEPAVSAPSIPAPPPQAVTSAASGPQATVAPPASAPSAWAKYFRDHSADALDPLLLPVPPAASATASQRVMFLRHRMRAAVPTTTASAAVGARSVAAGAAAHSAAGVAISPATAFEGTSFFDDALTSFESWLHAATWMASKRRAVLVDAIAGSGAGEGESSVAVTSASGLPIGQALQPLLLAAPGTAGVPSSAAVTACPRIQAPAELPVVLQMILSKDHRLRAMQLLARFVALGPEAVNLALIMGFATYLIKLVETDVPELRVPLVQLWASILAVDASQATADDLVGKAGAIRYFSRFIVEAPLPPSAAGASQPAELLGAAAFALSRIVRTLGCGLALGVPHHRASVAAATNRLFALAGSLGPSIEAWALVLLGQIADSGGEAAAADAQLCRHLTDDGEMVRRLLRREPDVRIGALGVLGSCLGRPSVLYSGDSASAAAVEDASTALCSVAARYYDRALAARCVAVSADELAREACIEAGEGDGLTDGDGRGAAHPGAYLRGAWAVAQCMLATGGAFASLQTAVEPSARREAGAGTSVDGARERFLVEQAALHFNVHVAEDSATGGSGFTAGAAAGAADMVPLPAPLPLSSAAFFGEPAPPPPPHPAASGVPPQDVFAEALARGAASAKQRSTGELASGGVLTSLPSQEVEVDIVPVPHAEGDGGSVGGDTSEAERELEVLRSEWRAAFPRFASSAPLRSACAVAWAAAVLGDGLPAIRLEAVCALGRAIEAPLHEAALATVAAQALLDAVAGGSSLFLTLGAVVAQLSLTDQGAGADAGTAADAPSTLPQDLGPASANRSGAGGSSSLLRRVFAGIAPASASKVLRGRDGGAAAEASGNIAGARGGAPRAEQAPRRNPLADTGLPVAFMTAPLLSASILFLSAAFHALGVVEPPQANGVRPGDVPARSASEDAAADSAAGTSGAAVPEDVGARPSAGTSDVRAHMLLPAAPGHEALVHTVARVLGARGLLYCAAWMALCRATADASLDVARAALTLVRRLLLRVARACLLEELQMLPAPQADATGAPLDADATAWCRACASLWLSEHAAAPPVHGDFFPFSSVGGGLAAALARGSAAGSGSRPDALSLRGAVTATQHRAVLQGLRSGTALAVSAYGDAAARALLLQAARLGAAQEAFVRRGQQQRGAAARTIAAATRPPPPVGSTPRPQRTVSRADLETHLRGLASETARLPPALLAQVAAGASGRARGAARRFGQGLIFDTGVPFTAGLLLHPHLDCVLTTGAGDDVALWSTLDGALALRFACAAAPRAAPGGLWPPELHDQLRASARATLDERIAAASAVPGDSGSGGADGGGTDGGGGAIGVGVARSVRAQGSALLLNVSRVSGSGSGGGGTVPSSAAPLARPALASAFLRAAPQTPGATAPAPLARFDAAFAALDTHARALGARVAAGRAGWVTATSPLPNQPRVCSMLWVDEQSSCHLLAGTSDGRVRIWSGEDVAAAIAGARWDARERAAGGRGSVGGGNGSGPASLDPARRSLFRDEQTGHSGVAGTEGRFSEGRDARGGRAAASPSFGEAPRLLTTFCAMPESGSVGGSSGGGGSFAAATPQPRGTAAAAVDMPPRSAQLSLAYLPRFAQLAAASSAAPRVRLWDLHAGACTRLLALPSPASSSSQPSAAAATCLASAWPGTHILLAGTAGGAVHVFDTRVGGGPRAAPAVVRTFREHAHYVVGVAQARTGSCYAVASGSVAADVCFWDLRVDHSLRSVLAHARGAMTCLAAHDFAPLVATGSLRQQVRVLSNAGEDVDDISHHESFGSDRLAPVTCVAWHPSRLLLAVGARDSLVSLRQAAS